MDLPLNTTTAAPVAITRTPPSSEVGHISKVNPVARIGETAVLPPQTQFVAQVVSARLSGTDFPESSEEIMPAERTLRPYDVPMLPYTPEDPSEFPAT